MNTNTSLGYLYSLREELAALCVVECRMSHERVVRAGEPMLPATCSFTGNYQRVGLCAPEVRARRLGCSHTSARIKLADAINELSSQGVKVCKQGPLSSELNWLDNQIHLLDHRKGEAEKTLARILENDCRTGARERKSKDLIQAQNSIEALERLHDDYVERMGRLRDKILIEINKLLEPRG